MYRDDNNNNAAVFDVVVVVVVVAPGASLWVYNISYSFLALQ